MLSPRGLGEGHVLIHAVELGFPPGPAEPTFRAAPQLHPTPHPNHKGKQWGKLGETQECPQGFVNVSPRKQ